MTDHLTLPSTPWLDEALTLVRGTERAGVTDHSIRTYLYARLVAERDGMTTDAGHRDDLVLAACLLHDLGLGSLATGSTRFEVEGADIAAELLTRHGAPAGDVDVVWEAIALHSSHGIADRRGPVSYLTYRGVFVDASGETEGLDAAAVRQIQTALPRPAGDRSVIDAIADHAERSPAAAPPHSIGADLLRERRLAAAVAD
ncbi:hypothetical protein ASG04_12600 [Curtobacterium sp. Leaf183]|uniref:HD domain-containing protein n=1 Tax=Curtobacterium sp. Leaf183 TaxID=1736291 RepID=UPI0006FF2862|nr:HD domain-containing protein [Curtobacterium sp. Leaf183]KQS07985.1 hypothetical protein ASG04_12600 [Curtobacterium sp. Leaf183]